MKQDLHCLAGALLKSWASMKPSFSFLLLAGLGATALVSGCAHSPREVVVTPVPTYSKVVSSDFEGRWIAEFIAEGKVRKAEGGYSFTAVQRRIFRPVPLEFHYPLGRPMTVIATNVIVTPASKPLWLEKLDQGAVSFWPRAVMSAQVVVCR